MEQNSIRQSMWMLLAGLSFSLMVQFVKVSLAHLGLIELVLYRFVGSTLVIGALLYFFQLSFRLSNYSLHLFRAVTGLMSLIFFYLAISTLNTTIAYAFQQISPLVFILLVSLALREKLGAKPLTALIGTFSGALLLIRPELNSTNLLGTFAGLGSGVCAGVAFYLVRKLAQVGEFGTRTVFFFNLHGVILAVTLLLLSGESFQIGSDSLLAVVGVIATSSIGQLALTQALSKGSTGTSASLKYCGLLFSLCIDVIYNGETFLFTDYVGIITVIMCGSTSIWLARHQQCLSGSIK